MAQRKISAVWQNFDEKESDNKVVCQLWMHKLAFLHLDVNLQGEQATTSNTWQTSIATFATPTHRCCDAEVRGDSAAHHQNDCL